MGREWEPRKKTVELEAGARPSRIRREPAPQKPTSLVKFQEMSRESEIVLAIAGMILFALGLDALWLGINAFIIK